MSYRIKELRQKLGMTQVKLAELSGISRATIWKLETDNNAKTMTETLSKLANVLGVTVNDLFFDKNA